MGGMDETTARNHPDKNIITRAVGARTEVEVDFFNEELRPGDLILMCSDGLTNMLEDEEILKIMKSAYTIREKALCLIDGANEHGGKDNIAVIIIEYVEFPIGKPGRRSRISGHKVPNPRGVLMLERM